jgi:PhzF family phenazine biosynthesis protein
MKQLKFKKIDAFATEKSKGNPAGYIYLNSLDDLSEPEMLQIAIELKGFVNEVGYLAQVADSEFDLRYYSSEREVDFCGHATIAIMYDLLKNNESLQQFNNIKINTNRGRLDVENRIKTENSVFIMSPEPYETNHIPEISLIAENLKIDETDISQRLPISIINAGLTTLIIPLKTLQSILHVSPDIGALNKFCINSKIDIIEVFTSEVSDKTNNYRTRVFAPTFGYLEDPATGSGNSALGYYLIKNNLWTDGPVSIEQNGMADQFNVVKLIKHIDIMGNNRVLFGGSAITRIDGMYNLY